MAFRVGQANFSKGEIAEELIARVDVPAYATALRRARNVIGLKYGGVTKRPGTRLVAEVYTDTSDATFTGSITGNLLTVLVDDDHPVTGVIGPGQTITSGELISEGTLITGYGDAANTYVVNNPQTVGEVSIFATAPSAVRLMPFQFSLTQTYALEMGQGYMRPAANGGLVIEERLTIEAVTPGVTTTIQAAFHAYDVGDQVYFSGITDGMVELNGRIGRVLSTTTDTYIVDIDSTGFTAFDPTKDTGGITRTVTPAPPPPPPPVPPPPPPPSPPPTGGGGGFNRPCVADDTLILRADGTEVEARFIKRGDYVRTRHERTLEWGEYPVEAIEFVWQPVFLATIDGTEIRATADHRFLIEGDWVPMRDLGEPHGEAWVAKITVRDAHTYVSAGILSHNLKMNDSPIP